MGRSRGGGGGGGVRAAASLAALLCCCCLVALVGGAAAQRPRVPTYKTLSGKAPLVIAQGGFAGIFPDSSYAAYEFAVMASAAGTASWCNVQLTKDGVGICLRDINLQNCTGVSVVYPRRKKNRYDIDGVQQTGLFTVDFTMAELQNVPLTQGIYSRTPNFDGNYYILSVTDLPSVVKSSPIWLNVQYDSFYRQHGLDMRKYIITVQKRVPVAYISSPELGFLQSIAKRVSRRTKLVLSFLDKNSTDPSTNRTYDSLLSNLTFVRTVASGIMIPKDYIWPVTSDNYLQPSTNVVTEAHKAGLEVYAADFANDRVIPYNYSYDPLEEYLTFIGSADFSVDGVLSDHPITASEAIGCFVNLMNSSKVNHENPLVISHNGASGDYPDCTDLAYHNAISDGADVIDCPVQVTSDGVLVCMSSINLLDTTNVQQTQFSARASIISEIQSTPAIFTFNLTWDELNNSPLKSKMSSPLSSYLLTRNPRYTNQGKFMKLSDFLEIGKDKDLLGVMIIIENAAFVANSLGFDIVENVTTALNEAGYNNLTNEVMIQSTDSAVLVKLKQQKTKYKLAYTLQPDIGDASPSSIVEIKKFANAVVVEKKSVFALSIDFIMGQNKLVSDLQSSGLDVYAKVFRNEFVSIPWDFFGDATVEINNYVQLVNISGFITDFPKTVRRYKKNSCRKLGNDMPNYMQYIQVGSLAQIAKPPAMAPMPTLNASSIEEPALPPVASRNTSSGASNTGTSPNPGTGKSDALTATVSTSMLLAMVFAALLI